MSDGRRVLCLGGNVALGARAPFGWPEALWRLVGGEVVNGGLKGARVRDVLRGVHHQPDRDWDWVIVQTGTYDARGGGTPPAHYRWLLWSVVAATRARWPNARALVCTPPPIAREAELPGFNRSARRWVERVAEMMRKDKRLDAVLLDLSALDTGLLADGVHPSPAGADAIARLVADAIASNP